MKKIILSLALALIFLYGCDQIVCNAPYMQVGSECCLDSDNNKICDKDEKVEEQSRITITEPKIIEKIVEVRKYVCSDGSIVNKAAECPIEESRPIEEEIKIPLLVKTNEQNTVIENVSVTPACPNAVNGGRIFFEVGTVPSGIEFQLKEIGQKYSTVFKKHGLYEGQVYFAICEKCRGSQIDFKLRSDKVYILRLMFNQSIVYSAIEYSNEHLIDTRAESKYMLKLCSG